MNMTTMPPTEWVPQFEAGDWVVCAYGVEGLIIAAGRIEEDLSIAPVYLVEFEEGEICEVAEVNLRSLEKK